MISVKTSMRLILLTLFCSSNVVTGTPCNAANFGGCALPGQPGNTFAPSPDEFVYIGPTGSLDVSQCASFGGVGFPNSCLETTSNAQTNCQAALGLFTGCDEYADQCCTDQTNSPSLAPSNSPSLAPTAPTDNPTNMPSTSPSGEPTSSPTQEPSASPSSSSPTTSPIPKKDEDWIAESTNQIIVGASGGGALLMAAAFFMWRRNRGSDDSGGVLNTRTEKPPKGRGVTGATKDGDIFDWEKHIDKKSGEVYFFNPKTGESRWDPPEVNKMKEDI